MTKPEWDGISQHYIMWDDVILPCKSVTGQEDGDEGGWCASLSMENRCFLDLHVPGDDNPCWVCISPDVWDYPESDGLPDFQVTIEEGEIVVRELPRPSEMPNDDALLYALTHQSWMCDVDSPEEVRDFLSRWGRLKVVRK